MKRSDFLLLLDEVMEIEPGTLRGSESLADFTWDSMKFLEFITLADQHFGVTVSPDKLAKCETVDDLIKLVSAHLQA